MRDDAKKLKIILTRKIFGNSKAKQITKRTFHDVRKSSVHGNILSLRELEKNFFAFTKKYRTLLTGATSLLLIVMLVITLSPKTLASTALFYPNACLGGWENAKNAEGVIETEKEIPVYDTKTSAVLGENKQTDLYCGDFKGEIPESTEPKKLIVKVAWQVGIAPKDTNVTSESFASSTQQILDKDASSTPDFTLIATTTPPDEVHTIEPATQSGGGTIPTKVEDPVSTPPPEVPSPQTMRPLKNTYAYGFLESLFSHAYAEEIAEATSTQPKVEVIESIAPESVLVTGSSTEIAQATTTASSTEIADVSTTTATTTVSIGTPIFEFLYTLDGSTWKHLGEIPLSELSSTQFEIPIEASSTWEDLSLLQIHIKRLPTVDTVPTIYLNGLSLAIEYDKVEGVKRDIKITNISNDSHVITAKEEVADTVTTLLVTSSTTQGMAMYKGEELVFTSSINENGAAYDMSAYPYGSYTLVATDDENWCGNKTLRECVQDAATFKGKSSFKIIRPQ